MTDPLTATELATLAAHGYAPAGDGTFEDGTPFARFRKDDRVSTYTCGFWRELIAELVAVYDLEAVYDEEIAPLVMKIVAICMRVNMPVVVSCGYKHDTTGYQLCSTMFGPAGRIPTTYQKIADLLEK